MPVYEVSITHSFLVKIQAESAKDAAWLSEFFLSYSDGSSEQDKERHKFAIERIEMTQNETFEVNQLEDQTMHLRLNVLLEHGRTQVVQQH